MSRQSRRLVFIAGGVVIAASIAIWILGRQSVDIEPPDPISRGLASALLLAVPGVLAWIGAASLRPTVVIAAGVLCLLQSVISFSGVTLIYLVPAIVFLRSTEATEDDERTAARIRPLRVLVAVVVSVPIALLVILKVGIFGVLALVALTAIAGARPRGAKRRNVQLAEAVRGIAIVGLVIAAWAATFVLTETACWIGHGVPGGTISWERIPPSDTLTLGPGDAVSTCGGGTMTPAGVGWAGGLVALSIAVAALPVRRGRQKVSTAADQRG